MEIITEIIEVLKSAEMIALTALMAANVILGIIAAFWTKTFELGKLGDFVWKKIGPMVVYIIMAVLAKFVDNWLAVAIAVYVGLVAIYGRGILSAIKDITKLDIPEPLAK